MVLALFEEISMLIIKILLRINEARVVLPLRHTISVAQ
ncbi:hypothetical protein C7S15_5923 [Burkholderia cepacia]|nr:hypothetical protein [Burkholderia cepacia]